MHVYSESDIRHNIKCSSDMRRIALFHNAVGEYPRLSITHIMDSLANMDMSYAHNTNE